MTRTNHQATKTLEEAVAVFLDDYRERIKDARFGDTIKTLHHVVDQLEASYLARVGSAPEVPRKAYSAERTKSGLRDVEFEESHESYGLVSVSRVHGSGHRLFGSSVKHGHFFTMSVRRARRLAGTFGERFYEQHGGAPIVDIAMTAMQFVDLITSANMGSGVPCTITRVEGVPMDPPPVDMGSELRMIHESFAEETKELQSTMKSTLADLDTLLAKKSLTKDDKEAIRHVVWRADRFFSDHAPWMLKFFGETAEKMAAKGRAEVESFVRLALERAGIKAIRDSGGELLLGAPEEKKENG